ncbi:hypothetical protein HaLaN_24173 [Haematococcus lacustris]|uniref:Uncharacterized protein n=1 Tax=Haematococcus lacustris TaxID=44745 RepID=A0A6A0A257_HAELA|nr:hypothetical protein HaLaN_24173 [Haematococcus lacustris]
MHCTKPHLAWPGPAAAVPCLLTLPPAGPALASSVDLSSFTHPGLTASLLVLHLQLYEAALIVIHHCPAPAASPSTTNPTAAHTGAHTSSVMGLFSRASASSRQAAAGPEAAVPAASASAVKPDQGRLLGGLRGAWASPPSQLPKGPPAGSPSSPTARLGQALGAAAPPATGTVAGAVRASASAGGASGAAAGVSAQGPGPGVLGAVERVLREAGRDVARRFAPSRELLLAAVWPGLPRQLLGPWVTLTPEPAPGAGSGQQLAESGKRQAATVPGRAGAGGTGPQQREEDRGRANGSKLWQLGQEGQLDEDSWASQVTSTSAISHPPSLPPPFPPAQHLDDGDSHSGRVSEEDVRGRPSSAQGHISLDRDLWQGLVRPGGRGRPPLPLPTIAATGQQDRQKPGKAGHSSTVSCWPGRRVSRPAVVATAAPLPAHGMLAQPQAERVVPAPTLRTGLTVAPAVTVTVEVGRPVPVAGEAAAAPVAAVQAVGAGELACQRLEAKGARVELGQVPSQDTASAQSGSTRCGSAMCAVKPAQAPGRRPAGCRCHPPRTHLTAATPWALACPSAPGPQGGPPTQPAARSQGAGPRLRLMLGGGKAWDPPQTELLLPLPRRLRPDQVGLCHVNTTACVLAWGPMAIELAPMEAWGMV